MPWIIVSANGEELERRELTDGKSVVIGRSHECDLPVRDILLSRTHCRLEPLGAGGWRVVDLNSKNGTRVGWEGIKSSRALRDGDHLRMGRTRIVFCTGPFEPAPPRPPRTSRIVRPADPHEALTGTVTDFVLMEEEAPAMDHVSMEQRPYPQPKASDHSGATDGTETAAETPGGDVASSFWYRHGDPAATAANATSIVSTPRVTAVALPRMLAKPIYREIPRGALASDTDLSLQADATLVKSDEDVAAPAKPPVTWRTRVVRASAITLGAAAITSIALASIWLLTLGI